LADSHQRFLELLEPVYPRLSRYALAVTKDEMDAEDLVSATILSALEQFDPDAEHENYLHYLIKIASRLHKRGKYRQRHKAQYDETLALLERDTSPLPDQSAELRIVMDALATLPDKIRETVVLFDVSDLSLEDIRMIQGGSLSGVKSRLKRGRARLAKALGVVPLKLQRHEDASHEPFTPFLTEGSYV
jgi:RNA polymerase sigma-70 factor (ECF subfamily)